MKLLPAVALPWLVRGRGSWVRIGVVLAVVALGFAPFLSSGLVEGGATVLSGLREYAFRWEAASLVHRFVEGFFARFHEFDEGRLDPRRLARAVEAMPPAEADADR